MMLQKVLLVVQGKLLTDIIQGLLNALFPLHQTFYYWRRITEQVDPISETSDYVLIYAVFEVGKISFEVFTVCSFLGCDAASLGKALLIFRRNVSPSSFRVPGPD
jgi:hypothetical protein